MTAPKAPPIPSGPEMDGPGAEPRGRIWMKRECEQCGFMEQQIILAQRFNNWMYCGFVVVAVVVVLFFIGVAWGLW